jgi:uncharacterized protein YukE
MLIKKYYLIIAFMLFSTTVFAQNDNHLIPLDDTYYIQSAINYGKNPGGVWDLPGSKDFAIGQIFTVSQYTPPAKKNHFQFETKEDGDRKYKLFVSKDKEYLKIRLSLTNAFVTAADEKGKNGTNIKIDAEKSSPAQNFRFVYVNNGRFKIYNENGKILQLESKSSANGKKITLWSDHAGPHTEWMLISDKTRQAITLPNKTPITSRQEGWTNMSGIGRFYIQSAMNFGKNGGGCFDIPGNNNPKQGDDLKVWDLGAGGTDRVYSLEESTNKAYYNIIIGPSLGNDYAVDMAGNGYKNGTNIMVWKLNRKPSQNFYFKHLGDGKYKIYNQNGKIITLANNSSQNGSNIQTWLDHDGASTEWYLLDVNTKKPYVPYPIPSDLSSIKISDFPGPESKKLASNINNTYKEIHKTEQRMKGLNTKAADARRALQRTKSASNGISDLNGRVNRTRESLTVFQKFPIIGTPVTVLGATLDKVKGKLNKANKSVQKLEKVTLGPTLNSAYALNEAMYALERQLVEGNKQLIITKIKYNKAASCVRAADDAAVISAFESSSKEANNELKMVNSSLVKINKSITELEKIIKSVAKLNNQLGPLEKQIKNINKAFIETDKAAHEINKVLKKKFKQKVAGKTVVNISLKDALSVGKKYTKEVTKYINQWVGKAIDPIIKRLNIKIPSVNIDGLKNELNNLNNSSKLLAEKSKTVLEYRKELDKIKSQLTNSFTACLSVPSCEIDETIDLASLASSGGSGNTLDIQPTIKPNLKFQEAQYDDIFNLSSFAPMLVKTAKGAKADIATGTTITTSGSMQKFYIKHQGEGYYTIYNAETKMALTVTDDGNVIPAKFTGKDNQRFFIIRDSKKYRYASFIISALTKKALAVNENGSVIQKRYDIYDNTQVWAFSYNYVFKNGDGLLGIKTATTEKEAASITNNAKTAEWKYIIHPEIPNLYYVMNANSLLFLAADEAYDKDNVLSSYKLIQRPYELSLKASVLFYMNYADDKKKAINIIDFLTRYVVDVDAETGNLMLLPKDKASDNSKWMRFSSIEQANQYKTGLTLKQKELVKVIESKELPTINEYLQSIAKDDFVVVDNIGGEKYNSLLAETVNKFSIDDKVQTITTMVRSAVENKDKDAAVAILSALTTIDFKQTNEVVESFKDIAQQSIRDLDKKVVDEKAKSLIKVILKNLD